ncbi:hypothetical protein Vafri_11726, partial [Volvox africanus]
FLQYFLYCCGSCTGASGALSPYDTMGWASLYPAEGVGGAATTPTADGIVSAPKGARPRREKGGAPAAAWTSAAVNELPDSLETWAHRILDVALLHHCDLVHYQSTVAMAS